MENFLFPLLSVAGEKSPSGQIDLAINLWIPSSAGLVTFLLSPLFPGSLLYLILNRDCFKASVLSKLQFPLVSFKKKNRPCVLLGIENRSHLNRNLSILTTII